MKLCPVSSETTSTEVLLYRICIECGEDTGNFQSPLCSLQNLEHMLEHLLFLMLFKCELYRRSLWI